jgi:hypothetical protein
MIRDSYLNTNANYKCGLPDPHTDTWQTSGMEGKIWSVGNTVIAPYKGQNGAAFIHSLSTPISDITMHGNYFSGGSFTVWFRNAGAGNPTNIRFTNNMMEYDSYTYHVFDFDSDGPAQCIEFENNTWDDQTPLCTTGAACDALGGPSVFKPTGGCPGVTPIPTWNVSSATATPGSCSQGSCSGVDLQASASGSQTGGSPRWRFNCGGTAGNRGGSHPNGADLWYDYAACNGQTSCTMTNVCDYSPEAAGTYTVRIYSESGPGSGVRVSDAVSASFVVSN